MLILASASPRRKELMTAAGYEFRIIVADDEAETSVSQELAPAAFVEAAARAKAENVMRGLSAGIVIAADTIAVLNNQIIGKPNDVDHAREILHNLQGTHHQVLTGVAVGNASTESVCCHVERTDLEMTKLTEPQFQEYLDSCKWEGKAGAFGYQDGLDWVTIVEGLESNVVGLPVELLPDLIAKVSDGSC